MQNSGLFAPYGLCVAAAIAVGTAWLCISVRAREKRGLPTVSALPLAGACALLGFVMARLVYCLFNISYFANEAGILACLDIHSGGFLLYGAVLGVSLGALWQARAARVSAWDVLDMLTLPGLLVIALCRMAEYFPFEGVGAYVENESLWFFPLAVQNQYGEWYFAVFLLEALVALVIMLVVRKPQQKAGNRFLYALLLYAAAQVVLESLRVDGCLKMGFVRVSQVLSAVSVMVVVLTCCVRAKKTRAYTWLSAIAVLLCCGGVGGLEWALDKTNVPNTVLYAAMLLCCALMTLPAFLAGKQPKNTNITSSPEI